MAHTWMNDIKSEMNCCCMTTTVSKEHLSSRHSEHSDCPHSHCVYVQYLFANLRQRIYHSRAPMWKPIDMMVHHGFLGIEKSPTPLPAPRGIKGIPKFIAPEIWLVTNCRTFWGNFSELMHLDARCPFWNYNFAWSRLGIAPNRRESPTSVKYGENHMFL